MLYLTWLAFVVPVGPYRCVDRPTFLVDLYGPTWLLCVGWSQFYCPSWSWWSDLTVLYGLTDPLSNPLSLLVLMVCLTALSRLTNPLSWLVLMVCWLLCMGWQIHCADWGWSDLIALVWAERSTVLVGPDGLTWLLCMGLWLTFPLHKVPED